MTYPKKQTDNLQDLDSEVIFINPHKLNNAIEILKYHIAQNKPCLKQSVCENTKN